MKYFRCNVQRLATGWTVRGSNPGGDEIFSTRPVRVWCSPSLLTIGYRVFLWGKSAEAWRWPPTSTYRRGLNKSIAIPLHPFWGFVASCGVKFALNAGRSLGCAWNWRDFVLVVNWCRCARSVVCYYVQSWQVTVSVSSVRHADGELLSGSKLQWFGVIQ